MASWFYSRDGKSKEGPVDSKTLRSLAERGALTPATLVWKQGLPNWVKASKINGLFPADQAMVVPPPMPEPPAMPQPTTNGDATDWDRLVDSSQTPDVHAKAERPTAVARSWRKVAVHFAIWGVIGAIVWNIGSIVGYIDSAVLARFRDQDIAAAIERAREAAGSINQAADAAVPDPAPPAAEEPVNSSTDPAPSPRKADPDTAAFTFKGLRLDMSPAEFTAAAPAINREAAVPTGAKAGFWSNDPSAEPLQAIPQDATGTWYYGFSFPPTAAPPKSLSDAPKGSVEQVFGDAMVDALAPGRREASLWRRVGWAVATFDPEHRAKLVAIKIRRHYGPGGPIAIAANDLAPSELARRLMEAYGIPNLAPNDRDTGWEFTNREEGWKVEFSVMHWTAQSADAGIKEEFLTWDGDQLEEFAADVEKARSMAGLAGMMGDGGPTALAGMASKLDTAWVLSLVRTTKSQDVKFD